MRPPVPIVPSPQNSKTSNEVAYCVPSSCPRFGALAQELGIAADVRQVGAVLAQRRDPEVERVGHVDRVRRLRRTGLDTPCARPSTRSPASVNTHGLAASRTASSTATPVLRWSAMFSARPPHVVAVVERDDELGPVPADRGRDVMPQRQPVLDEPVGVTEELDVRDTDDRRARALLRLAYARALVGRQAVDAGLAARDEDVRDLLPLAGPTRDRARGAVLHVVGVGDDRERGDPSLRGAVRGSSGTCALHALMNAIATSRPMSRAARASRSRRPGCTARLDLAERGRRGGQRTRRDRRRCTRCRRIAPGLAGGRLDRRRRARRSPLPRAGRSAETRAARPRARVAPRGRGR